MPRWDLKARLAAGDTTIGSWLNFSDPLLAEMMARAGFDWLVVDMEHGTASHGDLVRIIQVLDLAGVPALVRVGANDPYLIKRAMDAGACGVIVPMIISAAEAIAARDALYYPPKGRRGVGLTRVHDFGMDFDAYRVQAQQNSLLIVQIEHVKAVERLSEILDVDDVDGFIVGPYDMSGSIGKPGELDDPKVVALLDKVTDIMTGQPKPGGIHIVHSDRQALKMRLEQGYRFIAYGTEMVFLAEKLQDEMGFVRSLKELR